MLSGINMYAHIGGFIGGIIISVALGIKYKTSKFEKNKRIYCIFNSYWCINLFSILYVKEFDIMMLFRILSLLLFIIGLLIMFILKFLSRKNNNWPKVKKRRT